MAQRTCSVRTCTSPAHARGWCDKHYARWRSHGTVRKPTTLDRFRAKIAVPADPDGCWLWTGAKISSGYGCLGNKHFSALAHRFSYELWFGPIPDGLVINHLCCVPLCVRPDHLEAVTQRENIHYDHQVRGVYTAQTHCKNGHEFTPENTYVNPTSGYRTCRQCMTEKRRARSQRQSRPVRTPHPFDAHLDGTIAHRRTST